MPRNAVTTTPHMLSLLQFLILIDAHTSIIQLQINAGDHAGQYNVLLTEHGKPAYWAD